MTYDMQLIANTWSEAVATNTRVPCADVLELRCGHVYVEPVPRGDAVDFEIASRFLGLYRFAKNARHSERHSEAARALRHTFCASGARASEYLAPRSTLSCLYFTDAHAQYFQNTCGLDVGCITFTHSRRRNGDPGRDIAGSAMFKPTFRPHYVHYRKLGCLMKGIDIRLAEAGQHLEPGDIRALSCDDSILDFISIAMILGPGNPCDTYLDVALALAELHRSLHSDGLIYIADYIVMPNMLYLFILAGFRAFVNRHYEHGIPIGVFLIKQECAVGTSRFQTIINMLVENEFGGATARISNRNLLMKR